jgi:hypothetical protein
MRIRVLIIVALVLGATAGAAEARCRDRELDDLHKARSYAADYMTADPAKARAIATDTATRIRTCERGESDPTEAAKLERFAVETDVIAVQAMFGAGAVADAAALPRADITALSRVQRDNRVDAAVRADAGAFADRLRARLGSASPPTSPSS